MRVAYYCNQFFAGVGGEEAAGHLPELRQGAVGPGRRLAVLLGPGFEVVVTVFCGDDYAASHPEAAEAVVAMARSAGAELVVAGPAFTSGRYGLACARVVAAAGAQGLAALASMHPDNPGLDHAAGATVVASGATGREMGPSLERLAAAVHLLAAGEPITRQAGRVSALARRNRRCENPAAERAVGLALARLAGNGDATEIPLPRFDRVHPAAPLLDASSARVALCTEGALVPAGNPDRLESARATRWLSYRLEGVEQLAPGAFVCIHGGFSPVWANEDPHRIVPLDAARQLERDGRLGHLHGSYLVTAGNGTSVANARRFGIEWAAELLSGEVRAAILTAT
jgi:betaine reductase